MKPIKKRGRPTRLTEETQRKICEAILLGCTYDIAASYAGISQRSLYEWLSRGRDGQGKKFKDFYAAVKNAESMNAVRNLASIAQAAKDGNWTAAAWMLERRHGYIKEPDRPTIDITVDVQNAEVTSLIDQVKQHGLQDLITGPTIDLDEE
tara:strand:+ start:18 stop:470 length:453 start_codon:yes stop_codon:yes gene_type:complete